MDGNKPKRTRQSYSYQMAELPPSFDRGFYKDADMSRAAFERARSGRAAKPEYEVSRKDTTSVTPELFAPPPPTPPFADTGSRQTAWSWQDYLKAQRDKPPLSKDSFVQSRAPKALRHTFRRVR